MDSRNNRGTKLSKVAVIRSILIKTQSIAKLISLITWNRQEPSLDVEG